MSFGTSAGFGGVAASRLSYIYEPPDLSNLPDPNIGVAFKSMQKKDSSTKARGLEDLEKCIESLDTSNLDDTILEAWVCFSNRLWRPS